MAEDKKTLKGMTISFEIYAYDEKEAEDARQAIIAFISEHARQGRAVTARKVAQAVERWDSNPFVRSQIISYFT